MNSHTFNKRSIQTYVTNHIKSIEKEINNKVVLDIPAGRGFTSMVCHELGAEVHAYDLFPEEFIFDSVTCNKADITKGIPVANQFADYLICQEGYEHFSDQANALSEFNRCLKKTGTLLLTTPNYSSLKSKVSNLFFENEGSGRMPPNELDDVWMVRTALRTDIYYGHIFLSGIQKIRCLAKLHGFEIKEIKPNVLSKGSLLLFPFLYPLILFSSLRTYFRSLKKNIGHNSKIDIGSKKRIYREQLLININPTTLLYKNLFLIFVKNKNLDEIKY